jgi:alanine dehydrogenase
VGLVPGGVHALVEAGHRVVVEHNAGLGSAIRDEEYLAAGGEILPNAEVWKTADVVVKVKEPQESEYPLMRDGLVVFTYLHLAPLPELTEALLDRGVTGIAYETIQEADGALPLLTPMSEVAGRMAIQVGAQYLEKVYGGRGILLGGVPGVPAADVLIVGGGTVGINAAKMAVGTGARVTIVEKSMHRLRYLDDIFGNQVSTLFSNYVNIAEHIRQADLLIGAVLIAGASAPKLVTRKMISTMKRGAVAVDVAVDQGGCLETTRPTTHTDPVYEVDGVIHYCVTNMPAAVPRTSTFALTNATFPYILKLAELGVEEAIATCQPLAQGVNTYRGFVTHPGVAHSQGKQLRALASVM